MFNLFKSKPKTFFLCIGCHVSSEYETLMGFAMIHRFKNGIYSQVPLKDHLWICEPCISKKLQTYFKTFV